MQTNALGLVPCKITKSFGVYRAGQIAGFEPRFVNKLRDGGYARPLDDKVEAKAEADRETEDSVEVFLVGVESGTVQVPKNWREIHYTKRVALAKSIKPDAEEINPAQANEIIAEAVKDQEEPAAD